MRANPWVAMALLVPTLIPAAAAGQGASGPSTATQQGWSDEERRAFYHLSLGGEIFPLEWARALESPKTGRPFLEGLDRFGFLDDPDDADRLPIGLTAKTAKTGTSARMLGINCAACHVGEMTYNGHTYRIDGAPNVLMDFLGFNTELKDAVTRVANDPVAFAAFQLRLVGSPAEAARLQSIHPDALKVLQSLASWDQKDGARQMAEALGAALGPVFAPKKSTWPLAGVVAAMPPLDQPIRLEFASPLQAIGDEVGAGVGEFLRERYGAGAPLGVLDADPIAAPQRIQAITKDLVMHLLQAIWYLKMSATRMTLQDDLRTFPGNNPPDPGRLDDFRLARNLALGNPMLAKPPTSSTSFPPLWGSDRVRWLGWDANADSTMQRNIGTALAIGAVFDSEAGTSTIPLEDVYRLEVIGSKVKPPSWPFGSIDGVAAASGSKLYRTHCMDCHGDPAAPPSTWLPDRLYDPAPAGDGKGPAQGAADPKQVVGTDPNRAVNWYEDWDAPPPPNSVDGLRLLQKALYAQARISSWDARRLKGDRTETWRRTKKYAARPLTAIWAAAPYLHNDSVPTLQDLLQPVAKRPVYFRRGGRQFDPAAVGYADPGPGESSFLFDTTKPGNRNIGHEYGTGLSDMERAQLIEYLKTK